MGFAIVDTHVHLWDTDRMRYPWLDTIPFLNRPYLPADYRAACGQVEVDKIVFLQAEVETSQFLDEAEWVSQLARDEDARIEAIIPWAPLEAGEDVRQTLEKLAEKSMVKGVRRIVQGEPDPSFCLRPDFIRGVQALPDYGLHCEICIHHPQMAATIKMVEQCPTVTFILDHIGKPDIKNHLLEPWQSQLRILSDFPNVWCKMSGLVTEADHERWTKQDLRPYIGHVLDCFGFDRVMYGSDWPVVGLAAEYPVWVDTLRWALDGCSREEERKLFRENAIRFYRLG